MSKKKKLKVAVLLGGTSAERDVSMSTGVAIANAIVECGHSVEAIDPAYGDKKIDFQNIDTGDLVKADHSKIESEKVQLDRNVFKTIDYLVSKNFDVVFLALHGGYGENGQVQGLLELAGIPYCGSSSAASAIAIDKHISKIVFEANGVPTALWGHLTRKEAIDRHQFNALGLPLVVKPNKQGSTVGLSIVRFWDEWEEAVEKAFQFGDSILLERFIPGRELTVSILGEETLPVIEIIPDSGFYDYESKYQSGKTRYVVPAEIPDQLTSAMQEAAMRAHDGLGCSGYSRVDFRLREDGKFFCLEVNTLPGMTGTSLVPKAAKAVGLDFPELVERIIQLALK